MAFGGFGFLTEPCLFSLIVRQNARMALLHWLGNRIYQEYSHIFLGFTITLENVSKSSCAFIQRGIKFNILGLGEIYLRTILQENGGTG
jgi:hypothetical protein